MNKNWMKHMESIDEQRSLIKFNKISVFYINDLINEKRHTLNLNCIKMFSLALLYAFYLVKF